MINPTTLKILESNDWDAITKRLLVYTDRAVSQLHWRNGKFDLPDGEQIEDIVQSSIADIFSGTRNWNPSEHPDLTKFLMDVIDSKVSHLLSSKKHIAREYSVLDNEKKVNPVEIAETPPQDSDSDMFSKQLLDALRNELRKDIEAIKVIECFESEIYQRADIIEVLSISPSNYDKCIKRIRRASHRIPNVLRQSGKEPK